MRGYEGERVKIPLLPDNVGKTSVYNNGTVRMVSQHIARIYVADETATSR